MENCHGYVYRKASLACLLQRPRRNNVIPRELRSAVESNKEFLLATSMAAVCCYREAIGVSPSLVRRTLRLYRISTRSARLLFRSTAFTGKLMPAFRRLRPSSPLESCPTRPSARRLSTSPPMLPRDLSMHLDRMGDSRGFGGWEVEGKEGLFILNEAV